MMRLSIVTFAALIASTLTAAAEPIPLKGARVVVTVPIGVLKTDGVRFSGGTIYSAEITKSGSGIAIGGDSAWQESGFPLMLQAYIEKVNRDKRYVELEVRSTDSTFGAIKFRFMPPISDISEPLTPLIVVGNVDSPAVEQYRLNVYKRLATKFFTGSLSSLSETQKLTLLRFADVTAKGTTMSSSEFKGNTYLAVDVGRFASEFNEIRMNQAARVAYVVNEQLLRTLKGFGAVVKDTPSVYGLKLTIRIPHRNFLNSPAGVNATDAVDIYAPSDLIRQFDAADITNQKFIDGCVVIADDNRIEVVLSSTTP